MSNHSQKIELTVSGQDCSIGKQGSSLPTTKITTKSQNSHHSELPEIWLNGSLTSRELKSRIEASLILVGGAETWNRLVPDPCVMSKSWEGYLGCTGALQE